MRRLIFIFATGFLATLAGVAAAVGFLDHSDGVASPPSPDEDISSNDIRVEITPESLALATDLLIRGSVVSGPTKVELGDVGLDEHPGEPNSGGSSETRYATVDFAVSDLLWQSAETRERLNDVELQSTLRIAVRTETAEHAHFATAVSSDSIVLALGGLVLPDGTEFPAPSLGEAGMFEADGDQLVSRGAQLSPMSTSDLITYLEAAEVTRQERAEEFAALAAPHDDLGASGLGPIQNAVVMESATGSWVVVDVGEDSPPGATVMRCLDVPDATLLDHCGGAQGVTASAERIVVIPLHEVMWVGTTPHECSRTCIVAVVDANNSVHGAARLNTADVATIDEPTDRTRATARLISSSLGDVLVAQGFDPEDTVVAIRCDGTQWLQDADDPVAEGRTHCDTRSAATARTDASGTAVFSPIEGEGAVIVGSITKPGTYAIL